MTGKKRVILVDDQDLVREGLKMLLGKSDSIEVVAEAKNGIEFLDSFKKYDPDVVIMDINMPDMDGIEATRRAKLINPDIKVLALSMSGDEEKFFKMVNAGAKGFILKSSLYSELEKAILAVSENNNYYSKELLGQVINKVTGQSRESKITEKIIGSLSKQEVEVLKLISAGNSNEDIVKKLNLTLPAVKSLNANLLEKASCNNSASLVMFAIKNKLVEV